MAGINPQHIHGDANPWSWEDSRAMSWRSNFRALNPSVAQQAETLLGGPLSLALQAIRQLLDNLEDGGSTFRRI